jgi:hypothetical protein
MFPQNTPQQKISLFAKILTERFAEKSPALAFAGRLSSASTSSFLEAKEELVPFLTENPDFSFKQTNVDHFIKTKKIALSAPALSALKKARRLSLIAPDYDSIEALSNAGHHSAISVYAMGREPFLAQMTQPLGSALAAKKTFARAQITYAATLAAYGKYNLSLNGVAVAALASPAPAPVLLTGLPDLQELFGSLDSFDCSDCQSVLSPAAYLVDLLQYLVQFSATGAGVTNARDALFARRPDIQHIALSCKNTNITLPYIDLVNEVLESAIAPPTPAVTVIESTGTSEQRRALPQQISAASYALTAGAVFPLSLPFDLDFARTNAYLKALGTSQASLLAAFAANPATASQATAIAASSLGINPAMQAVICGTGTHTAWDRWGLAQNPTQFIDPKTRQPYPSLPTDWVAALSRVPFLLSRAGITLQQLYQLLESVWVTQKGVMLQLGVTTSGTSQTVSPDTDLMVFTGLTADVLDRANRFLRLSTASGLQMWELDWALEAASGGVLDSTFLSFLSSAVAVGTRLNLPLQEVLSFWQPLETRDVTSHLGAEDAVVPSTYTKVFRNPAVLVNGSAIFTPVSQSSILATSAGASITTAWPHGYQTGMQVAVVGTVGTAAVSGSFAISVTSAVTFTLQNFTPTGAWATGGTATGLLSGNPILSSTSTTPTAEQSAIAATLGLAAGDISAILAFTGAANTLSLPTLNVLLQYRRLSNALSLDILSLILWIQLTDHIPCGTGTSPADTLEFLRRLAVLQQTGAAVHDLDYLLRGQSASVSSVASTLAQNTAVLQTIRDALAKLPASASVPITGASNVSPIVVSTSSPTGLQTGDVVTIAGALGNTAANGQFTITVVNATSFTLNGSTGNGAWTGGGTASFFGASLDPAVGQTIFVNALAAAHNTSVAVVTALLPANLAPLSRAVIALLVLQTSGVNLTPFPALLNTLSKIASGVALFKLLQTTPADFAFMMQSGATFNCFSLADIPVSSIAKSPYSRFESLLRALALNRRQTAPSPRLFDVLASWLYPKPLPSSLATVISGASGLAVALNANSTDVTALATALGAAPPQLSTPLTASSTMLPGSLGDMAMLAQIANALDIAARFRIAGSTLVQLASVPATPSTSAAAMAALQAQYAQADWFAAIQPVEDVLRKNRRDALVSYLLGPGPAQPVPLLLNTDDIFDYYLIDPEMNPCALTTRLLQPSIAIQQFVQQSFLRLNISGVTVNMSNPNWSEWSWRQQFRLWQANRQVFLYPENYVLPETRGNASPFFSDLQNDLRQTTADADACEAAIENYLRKLVGVARLQVAAHYNEVKSDGSTVLHVFARTSKTPPDWFYATRTTYTFGTGSWSAWQPLNLDITSQHVVPVIWDQRLWLVWASFKQIAEQPKETDLAIPTSGGGGTPSMPKSVSTVEFAMSEFSAGQWQAKRTLDQKLYFGGAVIPSLDYTFTVYQDANFNLQIQVYADPNRVVSGSTIEPSIPALCVTATLLTPESALSVLESASIEPTAETIDLTQEPSFPLVNWGVTSGSLAPSTSYIWWGQDLVSISLSSGLVVYQGPVSITGGNNAQGQPVSIPLLGAVSAHRMVVNNRQGSVQTADPFFYADPLRTYLVHQQSFNDSPNSKGYIALSASYTFQSFYHPYARTFLRELEIGGVPRLMARTLQVTPQTVAAHPAFDFSSYAPTAYVATPYPGAANPLDPGESALDFTPANYGIYSLYNWEIFYHVPMFIASFLLQNQQYEDAITWLEYIFNPTDTSANPLDQSGNPVNGPAQHFWQTAPFYNTQAAWTSQNIEAILTTGINDSATTTAILDFMQDPFDPHAVASLRISAYAKATVMKFLDVLLAWGDSYYNQYTAEMVGQAEQLYVLADLILGARPETVRQPAQTQSGAPPATYASSAAVGFDEFSNTFVSIENIIVAPEPPQALVDGTATTPSLPLLAGSSLGRLFCVPANAQLLAYWDTVAQRLDNIRNCRNIQGVLQPLPLYAPPLNPLTLAEQQANGGALPPSAVTAPIYRFATYLQKAVELTNEVRAYGSFLLSSLEKQDAETLSLLRANQELDIQTRLLQVKSLQVTEAQDQVTALVNQQAVVQVRYDFYSTIESINLWEAAAIALQADALIANALAVILDTNSGVAHLLPTATVGVSGFGGTPEVTVSFGGQNVAESSSSFSSVSRGIAGLLSESGGLIATLGGYQRRQQEWAMQANLASAELTQIGSQIVAATDRVNIAGQELAIQQAQISNAQVISNFLSKKYTNAQLYTWMVTQLTTVYAQAYQLAVSLALQAQTAYQYELGVTDSFINTGYWDSQHRGLAAGESLMFDLRRMEAQYLAGNSRELELTKHISLALSAPLALVMLRETGQCTIALDELLFDSDYPGHYFRRLRSVAVTIPCVTGPYTGVNATLSLTNAFVRTQPPSTGYVPQSALSAPSVIATPATSIATSSGQSDAGIFETNLHDERWLPFEGQGAVSAWSLILNPQDNNFDLSTITDVILHLRYTARSAGQNAANLVRGAIKSGIATSRSILVSGRSAFGNACYTFFNPPVGPAVQQTLTLPMTNFLFPFSNLGTGGVSIAGFTVYFVLASAPDPTTVMPATFGVTGATTAPQQLSFAVWKPNGQPVAALSYSFTLPLPQTAPQSFDLTIALKDVPPALANSATGLLASTVVQDILLLIDYLIV